MLVILDAVEEIVTFRNFLPEMEEIVWVTDD